MNKIKYIQPKVKVLALPEIMQGIFDSSTHEEQLAKPNSDVEDFDDGWGLTDPEIGDGVWSDE